MKAKRKIDQKAIKQFFIDHTEKFVIGLVGLLFAYFAYQAFTIEHNPPHSVAQLQDATNKAKEVMQRGPMQGGDKDPAKVAPVSDYAKMIEDFKKPIELQAGMAPCRILPRVIPPSRLRETPEVFPVVKLRAFAGRGAMASARAENGPGNDAATAGQRWVVVTGLVPYRQQADENFKRFSDAASTDKMKPVYDGFLVQRAEVVPGAQGEPKWENKITYSSDAFTKLLAKWNAASPEVIEDKYRNDNVTSPLPPLVNAEWTDAVAYPPEIKLVPPAAQPGPNGAGMNGGRGTPPPAARMGADGNVPRGGLIGPRPGLGGAGARVVEGGLGGLNGKPKEEAPKQAVDEEPDYYLLRYFDFDVEAGKQYAYRVFAILRNPNFELPESVLADTEMKDVQFLGVDMKTAKLDNNGSLIWIDTNPRFAQWSKPCVSSKLPGDLRLLAGPTSPPKVPTPQEPTGEVRVLRYDDKTGMNTNFTSPDPLYRGKYLKFDDAVMNVPGGRRTKVPELDTGSILIDLAGELINPKDRDHSTPNLGASAMIVLDENGNLVIHDEMGDLKEWTDATKEPEKPQAEGAGRRRPGRGEIAPRIDKSDGPDIDVHRRGGR